MGDSWNAYRSYRDEVTKENVAPVKLERLPEGSERFSSMPTYFDAPAIVYRAPDGRIVEKASVNRGMWFAYAAFENESDWLRYRKPLPVHTYLHG